MNKECYWGLYIGDLNAPKGSGTLMAYLALEFIFKLGIRNLCAEIIDSNHQSISFHKKFSFNEEGTLRKQVLSNESYVDVILMSLHSEQWKQERIGIKKIIKGMVV